MPVSEQLRLSEARKLSPAEVLRAQIGCHKALGKKTNCFTCTHFNEAVAAAHESEEGWKTGDARPLRDYPRAEGRVSASGWGPK
jgi:Asp-tRNA(Asn)/Glu-tRNA(Gln) amidotransferase A subunit family amidase